MPPGLASGSVPRYNACMAHIYALRDEAGVVRYVGKANDLQARLASHFRDSKHRDYPIYRWLRKCAARGFCPSIESLEICEEKDWPARERFWISQFTGLLNVAKGGDEPSCSIETRRTNGRAVAKLRQSTPLKRKIWELNKQMAEGLKKGWASEYAKSLVRQAVALRPDLFGGLAKWL